MKNKLFLTLSFLLFSGLVFSQIPTDSLTVNPNPFNKRSDIHYYLSNADTTSLIVVNNFGATVITIYANILKASGSYQDSLIMDNFPNGVYFVSLKLKHRSPLNHKIIKTSATSISETESFRNMRVYPNPFKDGLQIEMNGFESKNISLEILNGIGELIFNKTDSYYQKEIDLSYLTNGIYFLRVRDSDTQNFFKIIKE